MRFRIPAILAAAALAAVLYSGSIHNEFTCWDDNYYVTENPTIRDSSPGGVLKMLDPALYLDGIRGLYYLPVTNLSYAFDYRLWGLSPFGFHLTNVFLYALVSALVYLFLERVTKRPAQALAGALLFAAHPAHVESVAWISARKDLFSLLFLLLSFLCYIRYDGANGARRFHYAGSLAFFFLALVSKPILVYLPALFVLYDLCFGDKGLKKALLEKIPFFALSALTALVILSFFAPESGTYLSSRIGPYRRVLTVLKILFEYMSMAFAPLELNSFYHYADSDLPRSIFDPDALIAVSAVLGALSAGVFFYIKGWRKACFAVFWFFIALTPILNIAPISTLKADRYLFVPSIGLSLLLSTIFYRLVSRNGLFVKLAAAALLSAHIGAFSYLTVERNKVWTDGITLWRDSIAKDPSNMLAHTLLGNEYRRRGMLDEALSEYEISVKDMKSAPPGACNNLGAVYGMNGRYKDAVSVLERCREFSPGSAGVHVNLARAYIASGDGARAREILKEALTKDPANAEAIGLLAGL